jgi:hypothetical protein
MVCNSIAVLIRIVAVFVIFGAHSNLSVSFLGKNDGPGGI